MRIHVTLLLLAIGLNGAVALVAIRRQSVTRLGGLAGFLVGTVMFALAGFVTWGMLMLFFASSSAISRIGKAAKKTIQPMHVKGHERDAIQVLANSSASGVASLLYFVTGEPAFAVAAAGGLAAANADTWSSELGVLSRIPPRSIVTREDVPAGASGGVTQTGTLAAVGGSLLIALWFAAWVWAAGGSAAAQGATLPFDRPLPLLLIILTAGFAGSLLDSYLGATVQALYRREDGSLTERPETVTTPNTLVRGRRAVTNDVVNFACTWSGAVIAGGLAALVG